MAVILPVKDHLAARQPRMFRAPATVPLPPAPELGDGSESELRSWYFSSQMQRARTSLFLAQLLLFMSVGVDLVSVPPQKLAAVIKLLVISPFMLITLWVARTPRWRHWFPHFMCASIIATGLSFCLIGGMSSAAGMRYDALVLVTVFTYFLGGLAPTVACATGLTLLAAHLFFGADRDMSIEQLAYESLFLLAVNALGMLSTNSTERSVREAFQRFHTLAKLSEIDPLTELINRRGFDRRYTELWERARREGRTLVLAFVDIDRFKNVNDRYGHEAGDDALRRVARLLMAQEPAPELCARLGGDEMVALWYHLERPHAEAVAGRLPRAVEALGLRNETEHSHVLTVSVGLAVCQPDAESQPGDCMRRADKALYGAKQGGRNRVALA